MEKRNMRERWGAFRRTVWWEYIKTFIVAFALVFGFMRPFVIEAFHIPSGSMENTLLEGDRILVAKFMYGVEVPFTNTRILNFHRPEVGDVFVFRPPPGAGNANLVKRIAGVPGDIIEMRDGDLYRNGELAEEDYVKRQSFMRASPQNYGPVEVPPEHVFAMGDNRDLSKDSRSWGFVPFENIMGQTFLTYWSWDGDADWLHKIRFSRIGRRVE